MQLILEFIRQQELLFGCLAVILTCLVLIEWQIKVRGPKLLGPSQTTMLINRNEAQIVDIRAIAAFNQGHILGAKHIAEDKLVNLASQEILDKTKPVIVICERGNTAKTAGAKLLAKGFANVYCLDGGMMAWRDENLPLSK